MRVCLRVALLVGLVSISTSIEMFPDASCTNQCDPKTRTCLTSQCTSLFDSCDDLSGYVFISEEMAPDESDCMDNGCTSEDCPDGWARTSREICASTHCKTLVCYQEACCRLRKKATCCKAAPCSVKYAECQVAQEKSLNDPSTTNLYNTRVAHTGLATFPFYSQVAAPDGKTCGDIRMWGSCYCDDGNLVPGCDPEASSTWYRLESSFNVSLPPGLPRTCTDAADTHGTGDAAGGEHGDSSGAGGKETGGGSDPVAGEHESGHHSMRGTAILGLIGAIFGGICMIVLLVIAALRSAPALKRRFMGIRSSSRTYSPLGSGGSASSWSDALGGLRAALMSRGQPRSGPGIGSGSHGSVAMHVRGSPLPAVPEEDGEVFTLEDLTDEEMGLAHHAATHHAAEMELNKMQPDFPTKEASVQKSNPKDVEPEKWKLLRPTDPDSAQEEDDRESTGSDAMRPSTPPKDNCGANPWAQ